MQNFFAQFIALLRRIPAVPKVVFGVPIATVGWVALFIAFAFLMPTLAMATLGLGVGLFIFLFAMPYIPYAIETLIQQPNRYRQTVVDKADGDITTRDYPPSKFGFFIKPFPGRDYRIERGGRPMGGIMLFDHHIYRGELEDLNPRHAEYWAIEDIPTDHDDTNPIPFPHMGGMWLIYSPFSILWWLWKRHVYNVTGAVFTGIFPFQGPRVYPMERFKRETLPDGKIKLVRIEDYSNHYRVAEFQFPVMIGNADTNDMIPIMVLINMIGQTVNPYETAYRTDDDWPTRFIGSATDKVTGFTRHKPLKEVWVAKGAAEAKALADEVLKAGAPPAPGATLDQNSTLSFGVAIKSVQVLDITPMAESDTRDFGAKARAEVRLAATKLDAEGEAAFISEAGKAAVELGQQLAQNPEALELVRIQTGVRVAEAAGKKEGNLLVMGQGGGDGTNMAILRELRQLRRR